MPSPGSLAAALADLRWLQRLAALLTRDPDEADDLVQQTLVVAWTHPPRDHESPARPWLATVLRNLFRMQRRAGARRSAREQSAETIPATAAPDHELARIEILHILVRELEQLPAEDQKIVVRRFFHGEDAADIARALGIPAATVRSRIHRSLQRLRSSLDAHHGPRARWSAAVLATPTISPPTKGSEMSIVTRTILATTLGTAGVAGWLGLGASSSPPGPTAPPVVAAPRQPVAVANPTTPRVAWEQRRRSIRQVLPPGKPAPSTPATPPRDKDGLRTMIDACMTDLGSTASGAMTMSVTEIGAPDIGTIYDDITIVETTFPEQEVLQCLVQSMHAWVGEAPAESFERSYISTFVIGKPMPEVKERRQFEFIIGAHIGEVRWCERRGDASAPEVRGDLDVVFTLADDGRGYAKSKSSLRRSTAVPQATLACILDATQRWSFPLEMHGRSFEYHYTLPIPTTPPPGPANRATN